ncbi:hypothetical protein C1645_831744 [Glomus cerebriforme]|uniref:Uncharacterized protein n=1 Tax=Glomus cerebriforme TaxID=658196 RepID=A0A397SJH5_9GLOM|nr:hypothetical protein C1645_831744 [Glomus cerebriforme]
MNKMIEFNYFVVLVVLMIMASVHNLIKSFLLYRAHILKISSTIKIIFNICGLACEMISDFAFSELVMIFLIWKLRQFGNPEKHDYIGYGLLLIRSLLHITYVTFTRPQIIFDPISSKCDDSVNHSKIFLLITAIIDLLIDVYVAYRFIQYIRSVKSNHYEQHFPLYSKLIMWNSLRILISSIHNINIITLRKSDNLIGEGGSEDDLEKISNNISESSISSKNIVLRASNGMLASMPLRNVRDEIIMEQQYNIMRIEPNYDILISQQSLSFYEVASMILGNE